MANRIYIAIGLIAILILGAAFVVPWFIDWNAYKGRMEQMAAEALGVDVAIAGDMDFTLLPQPRMHIEDVRLGPDDSLIGSARLVEVDFSLMDFLRDRFQVTQLRLTEPRINLVVDENGELETPITLAQSSSAGNVSIANAVFENGTIALTDQRSARTWEANNFSGSMDMAAVRGPFNLAGQAQFEDTDYVVRFATSAMNSAGDMQVSAVLRPSAGGYSTSVDGLLETGRAPRFEGTLSYRQAVAPQGEAVVGDLLLQSPIVASGEQVELSEFVLLPDENQPTTRLTGEASVTLGADPAFDATISGGVVTLVAPSIAEEGVQPYGLVRLLRDMPQPLIPPLPGSIAMSINELGVRGIGIRDVRLDATSDGTVWAVEEFSGRLSGDTTLKLTGTLGRSAGWPAFEGTLAMASARLDALSLMWRRGGEGNPLFGMSGTLNGQIQLVNDRVRLSNGVFVIDETGHTVAGEMRFGETPSLAVDAALSTLDGPQTEALLALMPVVDPAGAFGLSFPSGSLDLTLEEAVVEGETLSGVSLAGAWNADGLALENLAVADYGGVGFEGNAILAGTVAEPVVSGQGVLTLAARAPALERALGDAGAVGALRAAVVGSLPARLDLDLQPPGRDGIQSVLLTGRAGASDISLGVDMTGGLSGLGVEPIGITLEASADSAAALLEQVGVPPVIAGEGGAIANARVFGNPQGTLDTTLSLEGGGERIDYAGTVNVAEPAAMRGEGELTFLLSDSAELADMIGANGVWFPALEGRAQLRFVGDESVALSQISALAGDRSVSGTLNFAAQRDSALVSGALAFDALDVETLAAALAGPAALIDTGAGLWPDGPVDLGTTPRRTRGRIAVTAPALMAGEERLVEALNFDLAWGNEDAGLRGLFGEFGGGTIQLDATLCCASSLASKSLTGRMTLNGVALDSVLPQEVAETLEGSVTLGTQFQGSGQSYLDLIGSLNGEGSFSLEDMRIEGLSPSAFAAAADVEALTEIDPVALESLVATALESGPFTGEETGGLVSLVGGTAQVNNVAIEGDGARLLGGGSLDLETAGLSGDWTLALTRMLGGNGLITETTGRIGIDIAGTLFAPERTLDLGPMVDAIQMRAYEIELDELEALRAEQEARQQAAAEEQARLMEEAARRQAEQLLEEERAEAERLEQEEQQERLQTIEELLDQTIPQDPQGEATPQEDAPEGSVTVLPPGALELDVLGEPAP